MHPGGKKEGRFERAISFFFNASFLVETSHTYVFLGDRRKKNIQTTSTKNFWDLGTLGRENQFYFYESASEYIRIYIIHLNTCTHTVITM